MPTPTSPTFEEVSDRLVALVGPGAQVVREVREGAYSRASRWLVSWPDGERAFVKAGYYPEDSHGLPREAMVGRELEALWLPRLIGWDAGDGAAGEAKLLVLEDLSHARWSPPVTTQDAAILRSALEQLATLTAPAALPSLDPIARHLRHAWSAFASTERDELLATGLIDAEWLEAHGAALAHIERDARLDGDQLVHGDLWMQNWCRVDGRGAVIVDWAGACRGNARLNEAWAECAVRAAGGPGGVVLPAGADDEPAWAAWMSGRALDFAISVQNEPRERLVETVRREAAAAIGWLCQACGLPRPRIATHAQVNPAWRP